MEEKGSREVIHRIEIEGGLDRQAAEAFELEIRRLAKRYGVEIEEFRVGKEAGKSG